MTYSNHALDPEFDQFPAVQRLRRLGVPESNLADALSKIVGKTEKEVRAFDRTVMSQPQDTLFDVCLATLARMSTNDRKAPGFYPGVRSMRPFLKSLKVNGFGIHSPWPANRFFYDVADFNQVSPFLAQESEISDMKSAPKAVGFNDYLPLELDQGLLVSGAIPAEFVAPFFSQEATDHEEEYNVCFRQLGTRITSDADAIHVLQVLSPENLGTAHIFRTILHQLSGSDEEIAETFILHRTSLVLDPTSGHGPEIETAWFAFDSENPYDTGIGWSTDPTDQKIYSDDERALAESVQVYLRPAGSAGIQAMVLPTYFEYQIDAVEENTLDHRGKPHIDLPAEKRSKRVKAPKAFRVIRAVRKPDWKKHKSAINSSNQPPSPRSEPETQVPVQGYWRALREGSVGRDPHGNPTYGKTWVSPHLRWKDKPEATSLPSVKEKLAPHMFNLKN